MLGSLPQCQGTVMADPILCETTPYAINRRFIGRQTVRSHSHGEW